MTELRSSLEGSWMVEGVPHIKSPHTFWCGYSALSMLLQHLGYSELTPEAIFKHIQGKEYTPEIERRRLTEDLTLEENQEGPLQHPDINYLALAAQELTGNEVKAGIMGRKEYDQVNARRVASGKESLSPLDFLNANIIGGVPCMIRTPGHFIVVTGFAGILGDRGSYRIDNPSMDESAFRTSSSISDLWGGKELNYTRDTRFLMLFLKPKKK